MKNYMYAIEKWKNLENNLKVEQALIRHTISAEKEMVRVYKKISFVMDDPVQILQSLSCL